MTPRPPPSARPANAQPSPASRPLRPGGRGRAVVAPASAAAISHASSALTSGVLASVHDLGTLSPRLQGLSVFDVLPDASSQARQKHKRALSPRPGAEDQPPISLRAADLQVLSRVAMDQKLAEHIAVIDRERVETLRYKHAVLGELLDLRSSAAEAGVVGSNMGFLRFHAERERRTAYVNCSSLNMEWFSCLLAEMTSHQVRSWRPS
jgi:hypothetical protein